MDIRTIEFLFLLLLLFIVVLGQLARKVATPYAIVMVLGGLLLGFIPGVPRVTLQPDLIFLVVLPPLIYASAWTTSWRDFRLNLWTILFLAFGLVGFTVLGVAVVAPRVLTGFDWRLALVLGAIVAPTDAIAASSIARRIGLPSRIVDVLEGESLINDATGLLALQFAVALVVSNTVPTVSGSLLTLAWLITGGVGLGLLVGWVVYQAELRIDDGPIEIALSILTPYGAYFLADAVHASGVLAVVACGLYLSRKSAHMFSPSVRLQIWSFWESFTFVMNGLVFVLIGLQMPVILSSIREYSVRQILMDGALFTLMLILLRLAWVFPGSWLANFVRCRIHHDREKMPDTREVFLVGWTGMRGVLSLAAALALPATLANGKPFPERDFIVFLTFSVILVTLVLQGITLAPLARRMGLEGSDEVEVEESEARRKTLEAALAYLTETKATREHVADEIFDDLLGHYQHRLAGLQPSLADQKHVERHYGFQEISRETTRVERETAVRLRNQGQISDQILRRIERELDLNESRFLGMESE